MNSWMQSPQLFLKELIKTFRQSPVGFCVSVFIFGTILFYIAFNVADFIDHLQYRGAYPYDEGYDVVRE